MLNVSFSDGSQSAMYSSIYFFGSTINYGTETESIQSTYSVTFAHTPGLFFLAQPNPQLVTPYKTGLPSTSQMSGPPESPFNTLCK